LFRLIGRHLTRPLESPDEDGVFRRLPTLERHSGIEPDPTTSGTRKVPEMEGAVLLDDHELSGEDALLAPQDIEQLGQVDGVGTERVGSVFVDELSNVTRLHVSA
jgi:hypothetical protein